MAANSDSGDYHKNMDIVKFLKWVRNRPIPLFKMQYPNKKMDLMMDNAAYHHKRAIGSLGSLKKDELVDLMVKHGVTKIDLPLTNEQRTAKLEILL